MKRLVLQFAVVAICILLAGCNDDDSLFSTAQINQALLDMKGTYRGDASVSYYHGDDIADIPEAVAVSRDSLEFGMSLLPIADIIDDEIVSKRLRDIGDISVKAGYEFLQMDDQIIHFVLHPFDVVILGGYGSPGTVKFVFSQNFGGDADTYYHNMVFNISPTELWVNGKKCESFKQLVYHFGGDANK